MKRTKHGSKRVRQRIGVNKKAVDKVSAQAFEKGIPHKDIKGSLRRYLDRLLINGDANLIKVYSRQVWLFKDDLLITTWPLPSKYHKTEDKLKEKFSE